MTEIRKVVVNGQEYEVHLEQDGEMWKATIQGEVFEIQVPDAGPAPKQRRSSGGKSKKSGKVSANIPGKVVTVEVSLGDHVEEGHVVMILEAMKMQNEIKAGIDGKVGKIMCKPGERIEANVPLMEIVDSKKEVE